MKQLKNWDEAIQWMNDNPQRPELIRLKELEAKTVVDTQTINKKISEIASLQAVITQKKQYYN